MHKIRPKTRYKTRQNKTRQNKTRQNKTTQHKTTQDKIKTFSLLTEETSDNRVKVGHGLGLGIG